MMPLSGAAPHLLHVPVDGATKSRAEVGLRPEAKALPGPAGVQAAPRLAVGLRRVPDDPPPEAGQLGDQRGQVPYGDLESGPEVDRGGPFERFGRQDDPFRAVLDVEEFARR